MSIWRASEAFSAHVDGMDVDASAIPGGTLGGETHRQILGHTSSSAFDVGNLSQGTYLQLSEEELRHRYDMAHCRVEETEQALAELQQRLCRELVDDNEWAFVVRHVEDAREELWTARDRLNRFCQAHRMEGAQLLLGKVPYPQSEQYVSEKDAHLSIIPETTHESASNHVSGCTYSSRREELEGSPRKKARSSVEATTRGFNHLSMSPPQSGSIAERRCESNFAAFVGNFLKVR